MAKDSYDPKLAKIQAKINSRTKAQNVKAFAGLSNPLIRKAMTAKYGAGWETKSALVAKRDYLKKKKSGQVAVTKKLSGLGLKGRAVAAGTKKASKATAGRITGVNKKITVKTPSKSKPASKM